MKRLLLAALVFCLVSAAVGQGIRSARASASSAADRLREFQSNRELIEKIVDSSIELSCEDDCVKRVEQCSKIGEYLAAEMRKAANNNDNPRVEELSRYYLNLQKHGVAANVTALPSQGDSPALENYLLEIKEKSVKPLEDQLQNSLDKSKQEEVQRALKGVREGQAEVEKALKERKSKGVKPDRRGPGSGKNDNRFKD